MNIKPRSGAKLKVLLLPKYPIEGASSRYQMHQFIDYFENNNVDCTVSSLYSTSHFKLNAGKGKLPLKLLFMALACLKRIFVVFTARNYDLVFFHREALPSGLLILERWLKMRGFPMIFSYDDALFVFRPNTTNRFWNRLKSPDRIGAIMKQMTCIIAGNEYLADYARKNCDWVETIDEAEDSNRIRPFENNPINETPVIGWIGSPSTEYYLHEMDDVFSRLKQAGVNFRFVVVGGGRYDHDDIDVEHRQWALEREASDLNSFDVGIMPLPDNEWTHGKTGCKARMYMSAGIPSVAQGIGYNLKLIDDGKTGLLPNSDDEWFAALKQTLTDPSLRNRLGKAANIHVRDHYSIEAIGGEILSVMKQVAAGKKNGAQTHG